MGKPKRVRLIKVDVIEKEHSLYGVMGELIGSFHPHLADARIALAWHRGWKADQDGRCRLGQCRKASDLDRTLHGYDFVILLHAELVTEIGGARMRALLDHELCHAAVSVDENGEEKLDENGRPCWRIRKHDMEEFAEIVQRHGLWKKDVEDFAATCARARRAPLLASQPESEGAKASA